MKITDERAGFRRAPQQERSRQTVEVVLDAVERVLRLEGVDAITTNRIAEAAGVSIGSVYQYFPDKRSIFTALHQRHVKQTSQVLEQTVAAHASSSLEQFSCALVEALIDLHDLEPGLHEVVSEAVPESALGFRRALQATFEPVVPSLEHGPRSQQMMLVLPLLVEALVHGGMARRAPSLTISDLKLEAARAVRWA